MSAPPSAVISSFQRFVLRSAFSAHHTWELWSFPGVLLIMGTSHEVCASHIVGLGVDTEIVSVLFSQTSTQYKRRCLQ